MEKKTLLVAENIDKKFDITHAVDNVSLTIAAGEIRGLIGENGSGKSTLTSIIAGMQRADAGEMRFHGKPWQPTSMIDACSRATILDMLLKLRDEVNMTVIFITHDIGLAYYISDKVYIMEHGKFVESGPAETVIINPQADYTKRLINDVPKIYEKWDLDTVARN